jgi:hypothetical protein
MSDFGRMVPMLTTAPIPAVPSFLAAPPPPGGPWSHLPPPPHASWSYLPPPPPGAAARKGAGVALAVTGLAVMGLGLLLLPVIAFLALLSFGCGCT